MPEKKKNRSSSAASHSKLEVQTSLQRKANAGAWKRHYTLGLCGNVDLVGSKTWMYISSSLSTHSKIQTQGDRSVFLEIRGKLQKDTVLMRGFQVSESRHTESSVNRPLLTMNYYELGFLGKFFGIAMASDSCCEATEFQELRKRLAMEQAEAIAWR